MKKVLFSFLITLLLTNSTFASNNNVLVLHDLNYNLKLDSLSKNKEFKELVIEMEEFKLYCSNIVTKNSLSLDNVKEQLVSLVSKDLKFDDQIKEINKIFHSDVSERYLAHTKIFIEKMALLSNKYDMKDEKLLNDSYKSVIGELEEENFFEKRACGWRYNLCIVAAGAGAVLCHGGCDTTALATTAGLGIPACIWLCTTLQVAASVQCWDTYCGK